MSRMLKLNFLMRIIGRVEIDSRIGSYPVGWSHPVAVGILHQRMRVEELPILLNSDVGNFKLRSCTGRY